MSLDFSLQVLEWHDVESMNITHNLTNMWEKAGVYDALYNSEKSKAKEIIKILRRGIRDMEDHPKEYEKLNSPNGWGTYEHALPFLREVLEACERHPDARISISK